jgi:hypothetical protein
MFYITRGRCCDDIVMNVHAPTQDKREDMKDSFYEEQKRVLDQFPTHDMTICYEISMQK